MNVARPSSTNERPLITRVLNFPLVSLIIAVVLFLIAVAISSTLGKFVTIGREATQIAQAAIVLVLVVTTYKLAIVRLGERPRDELAAAQSLPGLAKGIAVGTALFSAVVGIAALLGVYRVIGRGDASNFIVLLVTSAVTPAVLEELLFRGILFRWIEEFAGSWAALVVTSAFFGLAHILNPAATWFSSFAIAVEAGLLLGGTYMLTRSLWMPIGLHAAWNLTQGAVFGVPVSGHRASGLLVAQLSGPSLLSGGGFGLEASLIAVAICAAAGAWFIWLAVKWGEVVQPWWRPRLVTAHSMPE